MADFSSFNTKRTQFTRAVGIVPTIRTIYQQLDAMRRLLAAYQGATDADLVSGVNAVYTNAQRTEIGVVVGKLSSLAADLEANHASLLQE